jgi:energy-coupling factor transporter ATP-binding protein EcfA2
MNNNEIFKKLRVALQLRDDQIVEILELVNFRISKGEIGNFFRQEDHPKFMECGDQVLRNFLNGLVIHLRGTKENPKNAMDVINENAKKVAAAPKSSEEKKKTNNFSDKPKTDFKKKTTFKPKSAPKKPEPKTNVVENVKFNNGKNKKK